MSTEEPLLYQIMEERYSPLASAVLGILIVSVLALAGFAVNMSAQARVPELHIGFRTGGGAMHFDSRPKGDRTEE